MRWRTAGTRPFRVLVCVALMTGVLMSGCALTFGYTHADWLIEWQADHYFDLASGQRTELRTRATRLLLRHRMEALPQYVEFLVELKERVRRGVTRGDMDWVYAAYDRFRLDLVERALPDGSALMSTVTEKQVQHVEQVLHREERKARESLGRSDDIRRDERVGKALGWAKTWVGPLNVGQREQLRAAVAALPDLEPLWLESRRQRRQAFVDVLRRPATGGSLIDDLRRIVNLSRDGAVASRARMEEEWRTGVAEAIVQLDQTLTPAQRDRALIFIQDRIDEIRTLTRAVSSKMHHSQ